MGDAGEAGPVAVDMREALNLRPGQGDRTIFARHVIGSGMLFGPVPTSTRRRRAAAEESSEQGDEQGDETGKPPPKPEATVTGDAGNSSVEVPEFGTDTGDSSHEGETTSRRPASPDP
ncbi:hypothetical protein OG948_39980 (plasmid) [Embleya sp. NBC_00888]|uniref:hypothetical protein n=1 Tax=Embleya sp. NBC_00888 TaxID=2975960 RepID=UPI002F9085FB|nr:hypothetical protein OG948_39980 [Embleya sp. NBC_00888]